MNARPDAISGAPSGEPLQAPLQASLDAALQASASCDDPAVRLRGLVAAGLDRLPLPGGGDTLARWQALAQVAQADLSLAKLFEGHVDALAILAELQDGAAPPEAVWGVWAAEAPNGKARIVSDDGPAVRLGGAKCWCSGAGSASHALLTAWDPQADAPQLVQIAIDQPGVVVDRDRWQAVGMRDSASLDIALDDAHGRRVGPLGAYLSRPGFWHGGAGIAACWYGGARGLALELKRALQTAAPPARSPFALSALGKVDLALTATAAVLRDVAHAIDADPARDARALALRARLAAEQAATAVLHEVGRTLGAAPFCRDRRFARAAADLPVFIRQSHAERDSAALGACVLDEEAAWPL